MNEELKLTGFKMLEKPPYTTPIPKNSIEIAIKGALEEEKTYGSVFSGMYIKYALQFISQKYGETPKEYIKTLDQLEKYLVSISDKHPTVVNAVLYAGSKAESELQGKSGAAARVAMINLSRKMVKESSFKERTVNIDQLLSTLQQTLIQLGVAHCEVWYRKNADESVDIIWPSCHLKEGCRLAYDEGALTRVVGGLQCVSCAGMLQLLKLLSGFDWDYELLEFDKPYCMARIFMV